MDKIKERLNKLLDAFECPKPERYECKARCNACVAKYLAANGVTIEEWIPVTERLPEDMPENKGKRVINCIVAHLPYKNCKLVSQFRQRKYGGEDYGWYWSKIGGCSVTHWKPMPEPPIKQEESR